MSGGQESAFSLRDWMAVEDAVGELRAFAKVLSARPSLQGDDGYGASGLERLADQMALVGEKIRVLRERG